LKKILEQETYVLGRGTDADIQINDPGISRKHLAIEINEKIVVTDLNSTNGTFLNEEKITVLEIDESVNLRIGQTQLSIYRETK
jgi:pSer/pThr/pTyr-binding forkhead associated (FHA) protein